MVTVYSKPACVQCNGTYRRLDEKGIKYKVHDLSQDPQALEMVRGLGYQQAPVVVLDSGEHWSGYRPDLIDNIQEAA